MLQEYNKDVYLGNSEIDKVRSQYPDDIKLELDYNETNAYTAPKNDVRDKFLEATREVKNIESGSNYYFGEPLETNKSKASFTNRNYNTEELYSTENNGEVTKNYETYTPGIDNYETHNTQNLFTFINTGSEGIILIHFIIRIIGSNVCSSRAKKLNRNSVGWGIFGFIAPIIAMIWTNYLKPSTKWDKN